MSKYMQMLAKARAILHTVAIIASAAASALAAATLGGDPLVGAAIGAGVNSVVALVTA